MQWSNIWNYRNSDNYHLEIKIFRSIEQTKMTSKYEVDSLDYNT